jgi:hypothetical protein
LTYFSSFSCQIKVPARIRQSGIRKHKTPQIIGNSRNHSDYENKSEVLKMKLLSAFIVADSGGITAFFFYELRYDKTGLPEGL